MDIYSFDVFDTCFVRTCGRSEFVFDLLADHILGGDSEISQRMDFSYIRRQAEEKARMNLIHDEIEEVSLLEIYDYCDFSSVCDVAKSKIMEEELKIESEVLIPVYGIKKRIDVLRERGTIILFISDMYLPEDFICRELKAKGLYKDGDKLYVSSSCRKTKRTGNLYEYIKTQENFSFRQWIHSGDNVLSDIKVPHKRGIRVNKIAHKYTFYEKLLSQKEFTSCKYNLMMMASISKALRLSYEKSSKVYFAADFIAPIYVPYVYSLLIDAQKRGINDLFFLSRDGLLFYEIARRFQTNFPSINFHYIYVSRKSLYLPSMDKIDADTIRAFFTTIDDLTLIDVLDKFQLIEFLNYFRNYIELKNHDLLSKLVENVFFCKLIRKRAQEQRRLCLKYFEENGLFKDNCAIIDLSGSRNSHVAINKILSTHNYPHVFGYYFDVLRRRIPGMDYYSAFFADRYKFNKLNLMKWPQYVFEQYFSVTNHESTAFYKEIKGRVEPVFEKGNVSEDVKETYMINKSVCLDYADIYMNQIDTNLAVQQTGAALSVYTVFAFAPSPFYLKALTSIREDESAVRCEPLLKKQTVFSIIKHPKKGWATGNLVYNSFFPNLMHKVLLSLYIYLKFRN